MHPEWIFMHLWIDWSTFKNKMNPLSFLFEATEAEFVHHWTLKYLFNDYSSLKTKFNCLSNQYIITAHENNCSLAYFLLRTVCIHKVAGTLRCWLTAVLNWFQLLSFSIWIHVQNWRKYSPEKRLFIFNHFWDSTFWTRAHFVMLYGTHPTSLPKISRMLSQILKF